MVKYAKLGPKASSFNSPWDKFNLIKGQVKELPKKYSDQIRKALQGGHLVETSEYDYKEANGLLDKVEEPKLSKSQKAKLQKEAEKKKELEELKAKLEDLDDEELVTYYEDTYTVSKEEVKALQEMDTEEKVKYLLSLEE